LRLISACFLVYTIDRVIAANDAHNVRTWLLVILSRGLVDT